MRRIATRIAINAALAVPPLKSAYWKRQRHAGGYGGEHGAPERINDMFRRHAGEYQALLGPIDGDLLEIGPGGSVGVALKFLDAGAATATCADVVPLLSSSDETYDRIVPGGSYLRNRVQYRCPDSIATTLLPSESFDFVYSSACLEHIDAPVDACWQIARLLKPGGAMSHQIDLRDHTNFDAPLDFLRYSDRVWSMNCSRRIYTNRWRASDWISGFEDAGLRSTIVARAGTYTPDSARKTER